MVDDRSPSEIARRLRQEPATLVLLDVREPWERELAVIEPSLHIPMDEIMERSSELPKDREIVVYCHSGTRSAMVAGYLEHNGFPAVANLGGGIDAWSLVVDPKVPRYG
jgi:rhodanese-related sulfurtransferase